MTQSQNASAKLALIIRQESIEFYESARKVASNWYTYSDFIVETTQCGLGMLKNHFFLEQLDKVIQRLVQAGIMEKLIVKKIGNSKMFVSLKSPKRFSVDNLSYGFVIWLGFCGISFAAFCFELFFKLSRCKNKKKKKKMKNFIILKFEKVHPILITKKY